MFKNETLSSLLVTALLLVSAAMAVADGGVVFTDIAEDGLSGLSFTRFPSADYAAGQAMRQDSLAQPLDPTAVVLLPVKSHGQPGVAVFDFDGDRDLDIYVTNGAGAANSLFSNQLMELGTATFVDVAAAAGVAAADQDGMGVCYGDTDNDGDQDLLVLGRDEANRFFENLGDGTFAEVTGAGLDGGDRSSPSCAMGDVDNDGLLDIVVANSWNQGSHVPCLAEPFALNQHNQLFRNQGSNRFADVSATSGVEDLAGFPEWAAGSAGLTWATAMVDVDSDGDTDIVFGDDQCAMPGTAGGGVDRGFIHVLLNSGDGQFTDQPVISSPFASGSWMGLAFGDLDCDGHLDIFASNMGDYGMPAMGMPYALGAQATRALFGNGDGTFSDPGVGDLIASVFGWGNAIFDYDNDGDLDVLYHGGLDFLVSVSDNPGTLLRNQGCSGSFERDQNALTADHLSRTVEGVAVGDLDQDGFADVVTASSFNIPPTLLQVPSPVQYGASFDTDAYSLPIFDPTPEGMVWNGAEFAFGDLAVELSSGGNGNGWAAVTLVGSVGLTDLGQVNRSAIGAVASFTPEGGEKVMVPVQGGSSFGSQHSLETTFGMGSADAGTLEVLWPGGVRNRLYGVRSGSRFDMPEIPCSIDGDWKSVGHYRACVREALRDLRRAEVITAPFAADLFRSAMRAFGAEPQQEVLSATWP